MEIVKFKIRKKLSLFMTACVLATGLMSGCSSQQVISETQNGTQSGNAKGRFVENEVSLPDNLREKARTANLRCLDIRRMEQR